MLALITPDYFGAVEGESRRIDRADDPVCEELIAAFDANAQIIPLLSEGVKMLPRGRCRSACRLSRRATLSGCAAKTGATIYCV